MYDTKLDNNWNLIQNLIGFSLSFGFNYIYRLVIGLCVARFLFGKYYDWRTFFWEKKLLSFLCSDFKKYNEGFYDKFC